MVTVTVGTGKDGTTLTFSNGKVVELTKEEGQALDAKINFHLTTCGLKRTCMFGGTER